MTVGLVISLVLHVSLLGFALVSVAATPAREPKLPTSEPIVADVITASELNRMRKGVREAKLDDAMQKDVKKPDEAKKDTPKPRPVVAQPPPPAAVEPPPPVPEPPKPVEVAKAEPPPPPPKAAEPPKEPEPPKPEPDKAALDKVLDDLALQKADEEKAKAEQAAKAKAAAAAKAAEAKAKAEADAKADAEAKAKAEKLAKAEAKAKLDKAIAKAKEAKAKAEKAKQLDTSKLSALLDKTPDPKQAAAANEAPAKPTTAKGPVKGAPEGKDQTISANEKAVLLNLIIDTVKKCWNVHAGGQAAGNAVPKVRWELNPDGTLRGSPRLLNPQSSPQFQLAADAAMRAVVECNRFTLPPDLYQSWKTVTLDFDPNDFLQ